MSLAPAEQRALDRIEFALYGSDRRLAHTLSRFKLPLAHGGLTMMVRQPRPRNRVIAAVILVMALGLLVAAVWNGSATSPTCASSTGPALTATKASDCQLSLHRGHEAGTAQNSTAK
jgi:hypothetical protein